MKEHSKIVSILWDMVIMMKIKMTAKDILEFQKRKDAIKTIGEFKTLGIELRDKYQLTDREAIDLLNNKNVLEIMARMEYDDT